MKIFAVDRFRLNVLSDAVFRFYYDFFFFWTCLSLSFNFLWTFFVDCINLSIASLNSFSFDLLFVSDVYLNLLFANIGLQSLRLITST